MVVALQPSELIDALDISLPALLLGSKKKSPTDWRNLTNALSGKTKHPQRKTLGLLSQLLTAKSPSRHEFDLHAMEHSLSTERPWESFTSQFNAGLMRSGSAPFLTLSDQAVKMELIGEMVKVAAQRGDLRAAFDHVRAWELNKLPSLQRILEHIDHGAASPRLEVTAAPLVIVSTLYLWACFSVDAYGITPSKWSFAACPERRGKRLIRPMTKWLETIKAERGNCTLSALSDLLLSPRDTQEGKGLETSQRLVRKWWQKGEIPSWSRVPHIVTSMCKALGEEQRDRIELWLIETLIAIRLFDYLLSKSIILHNHLLPKYDPLAPFDDYPLMLQHAAEVKATLPHN